MLLYTTFYRNLVFRRVPNFNQIWNNNELIEMPLGSIIHLIDDNFSMNKPTVFVPDVTKWLMTRSPTRKHMLHITQPIEGPLKYEEPFMLPSTGVITTITNFRREHATTIRPVLEIDKLPPEARIEVQSVVSYNSLYRARIFGLNRQYRRSNYIWTALFNTLALYPERKHFIPIPVGNRAYSRQVFLRTLKAHTRQTLAFSEDPWYLFMVHLLGFLHNEPTPSIFEKLPAALLKNIHFVLYNKDNFVIFELDKLKELNGSGNVIFLRLINYLNNMATKGAITSTIEYGDMPAVYDTEVNESLPEPEDEDNPPPGISTHPSRELMKRSFIKTSTPVLPLLQPTKVLPIKEEPSPTQPHISIPLKHPNSSLDKPKLPDLPQPTIQPTPTPQPTNPPQPTPTIQLTKVSLKTLLDSTSHNEPIQLKEEFIADEIEEKWITVDPDLKKNEPRFIQPPTQQEHKLFAHQLIKTIDSKAQLYIDNTPSLSAQQRIRAEQCAKAYKSINLGPSTLLSLIEEPPNDNIDNNPLDFLGDSVPDTSMLVSSVSSFEHDYVNKNMFKRDLASTLVSFNQQGMFLTNLIENDVSDKLNQATEYIAKYEDTNHKEHTIKFTLPKVDDRGFCLINGVEKILKKQRILNPLCKVSATRVAINLDMSKYLVERNTNVAHNFIYYIDRILKSPPDNITIATTLNHHSYNDILLPYEFSAMAKKYDTLTITRDSSLLAFFSFDFHERFNQFTVKTGISLNQIETIKALESEAKGYAFMVTKNHYVGIMKLTGEMLLYSINDETLDTTTTLIDFLCTTLESTLSGLNEWTEFKLLNKAVPTIFALCYKFGLSHMLNYTRTNYKIYRKNERILGRKYSDILLKFSDFYLVIPRAPMTNSLLFAGLNLYELGKINLEEMDSKDVYYDLIQSRKVSVYNLRAIDDFFDLALDPIAIDVLQQMHEPTNTKDLLIRATQMLSTEDFSPPASSSNFRFRSYERMNSAVYRSLSRAFINYRNKSSANSKFSITAYEIKQMLIDDQLMEGVDTINPINDIKYQCEFSHGGIGGRSSIDTFMLDDRQYPEDAVGIISEATVDSGKTAFAASTSMDPTIVNMRGMTVSKPVEELEPSQILSIAALLSAGVTQDDGKRCNFVSIHLSHYLPTVGGDVSRIRTGMERVIAHRCRLPFAYTAESDGEILAIQDSIITVKYKTNKIVAVHYGEEYTNNGGGGFYCTQNIAINNFEVGDKVKRGDVIVYNDRFFTEDPLSKQVDWNIGVLTNVVLMEHDVTLDDGSAITKKIADKLRFNPVHIRDITLTKDTTVHRYAAQGTMVTSTDPLLMFDESAMSDNMFGKLNKESAALLAKLNRRTPMAKHTGKIVKIEVYFKCAATELSNSLKGLVGATQKERALQHKAAMGADNASRFQPDKPIKYTDRLGLSTLDNDSVIVRFYIQQDMSMSAGDKQEFDSSLKSIATSVIEESIQVEDGSVEIDAIFSGSGISRRLVMSPIITGIGNRVMEKLEQDLLHIYFG